MTTMSVRWTSVFDPKKAIQMAVMHSLKYRDGDIKSRSNVAFNNVHTKVREYDIFYST